MEMEGAEEITRGTVCTLKSTLRFCRLSHTDVTGPNVLSTPSTRYGVPFLPDRAYLDILNRPCERKCQYWKGCESVDEIGRCRA